MVVLTLKLICAVLSVVCLVACHQPERRSIVVVRDYPLKSIVVSGFIRGETVTRVLELSGESGWTLPVEFKQCEGGELAASERLADEIRSRKLRTRADGYVASGCAYAYLAGVERLQVEDSFLLLHFHAPSHAGKPIKADKVEELMKKLEEYTDGKFPGEWRSAISTRIGGAGVYFFSAAKAIKQVQSVAVCERKFLPGDKLEDACTRNQPVSFEVLGLTTSNRIF
jgi:hypothetical protein